MSSLQCPATLLLAACADDAGVAQDLARRVAGRRVASVWTGTHPDTLRTAEVVASQLGMPHAPRGELDPSDADEALDAAVERLRDVLQEAADLHRGEVVLLVTTAELIASAVPRLARTPPHPPTVAAGGLVELEVDEEWWCRAWEGPGTS